MEDNNSAKHAVEKTDDAESESECSSPRVLNNTSKVMIALDNSSHSRETIDYYLRHVHRKENDVLLAHVIELPENAQEAIYSMMSQDVIAKMWSDAMSKAEEIEKDYAAILKREGVEHVHIQNGSGLKPGPALCHIAEEKGVNMIVIGSRGEGKIRRTLLGSVSDYIVHHAPCPTLVCKHSKSKDKHAKAKRHDKKEKH